jgi:hypothetical protein
MLTTLSLGGPALKLSDTFESAALISLTITWGPSRLCALQRETAEALESTALFM